VEFYNSKETDQKSCDYLRLKGKRREMKKILKTKGKNRVPNGTTSRGTCHLVIIDEGATSNIWGGQSRKVTVYSQD